MWSALSSAGHGLVSNSAGPGSYSCTNDALRSSASFTALGPTRALVLTIFFFIMYPFLHNTVFFRSNIGVTNSSRDGDILIGGIFPIHGGSLHKAFTFTEEPAQQMRCEKLISDYYQWFQVMVFAIEEINNNSELLPNITLGFRIYDSCMMIQHAIKGTLWMLTGLEEPIPNYQCSRTNPPATIIGEMTSSISVVMARILGLYQHPQISYSASSSLLSDRNQFPSFFRTMPSDDFQAQGLVQLLIHFGWTWIGLLAEDSDYGQQGAHIVQEELTRAGACVAFFETIRTNRVKSNTFHIAWVIKNSTANVVLIFSTDYIMIPLLDELVQQRVTGKTWVSTDGWTTSRLLSHEKYSEILSGTLGFDVNSGYVHSLGEYFTKINPLNSPDYFYIRQFWEVVFGCKWPDPEVQNSTTVMCTGNEKLDSVYAHLNNFTTFRIKYNIYTAVRATANALHNMMSCRSGSGPFYNGICVDSADFQPWQWEVTIVVLVVGSCYGKTWGFELLLLCYKVCNNHQAVPSCGRKEAERFHFPSAALAAQWDSEKLPYKGSPSAAFNVFCVLREKCPTKLILLSASNARGTIGPMRNKTNAG
ncbi:hypothetical protein NDU88_000606 [Pleurodeles waltl]|uniref:Receptor ligand binding region domain-containing protein n=1 Tax=Pleurodeles waltl TaxID=8319 RepID=A0AAV7KME7_PLEWA|nr:hypothetical protein NDU88_000606 [Pleurodeles waltl]